MAEEFVTYEKEQLLAYSNHVSGNLINKEIYDVVFVKPDKFDNLKTNEILMEIDELNSKLAKEKKQYLLIGFGRWGTADRFLGIPAKWNNISGAKVIIESNLKDFQVDFSQGSHFFHNISSAGIPYFYIKYNSDSDFIDWDWLNYQEPEKETTFFRHVRTGKPLTVVADGKKRSGMVIKPG